MIKSIVENTIDKNYLTYLRYIIHNPSFNWSYTPGAAYPQGHPLWNDNNGKFLFSHRFLDNYQPNTDMFDKLYPAVLQILSKHDISLDTHMIRRATVNLLTRNAENIVQGAHVDHPGVPHDSLLWYLDDSDGDTIIYNQQEQIGNPLNPSDLTIDQRITPEQNRSVCFDGLTYHSSSSPTKHNTRILMNINITPRYS